MFPLVSVVKQKTVVAQVTAELKEPVAEMMAPCRGNVFYLVVFAPSLFNSARLSRKENRPWLRPDFLQGDASIYLHLLPRPVMYLELCHPQAIGDGGYGLFDHPTSRGTESDADRCGIVLVGKVYHALMAGDKSKPRKLIALKKARTTSLVTNPVLRHEACVLLRLRGRCFATN